MENIFEILFYNFEKEKKYNESINILEIEIENNRKRLSGNFNKARN